MAKGNFKYKPKEIADVIRKHSGLMTIAARSIGCSPATLYEYRKKFPCVREAIEESRENMTDRAESALSNAIDSGESWAVQFYLKTQGKNRGYCERVEQVQLTDEEVNRLIEREIERLEAASDERSD